VVSSDIQSSIDDLCIIAHGMYLSSFSARFYLDSTQLMSSWRLPLCQQMALQRP